MYAYDYEANVFVFELFLGDFPIGAFTLVLVSQKTNECMQLGNSPSCAIYLNRRGILSRSLSLKPFLLPLSFYWHPGLHRSIGVHLHSN
mgnify:CR=1 FL=1